ncbi:hypothetical protein [Novosphingobium sp.]|uniref:hypothetical protein n=1 Tax=Novosphingobium sp. TaxID=1874826 RepID=UPI002732B049|nr:hypothetical protein [Novosphingobium sp.]
MLPGSLGAQQAKLTAQNARHFAPPQTPVVLSRTIWRSLPDGKNIMVRRSYEVRIAALDDGYLVNGALLDTVVEAPPPVAMLAELERKRPDAGPFPLRLDRHGIITEVAESPADGAARADATRGSALILKKAAQSGDAQDKALAVLTRVLSSTSGSAAWPIDLFNPAQNNRHEVRRVPLPGGASGEVDVSINVQRPGPGPLPELFERTVITRLDGSERTSREVWTIGSR